MKDNYRNIRPKLYFKYKEDGGTIDMSTVQWYATAEEQEELKNDETYSNKAFWGAELTDATQKNLLDYLPKINGGLNASVKNRYLCLSLLQQFPHQTELCTILTDLRINHLKSNE